MSEKPCPIGIEDYIENERKQRDTLASEKACPIGIEDCIPQGNNNCINFFTCLAWTKPWPLPLTRITHDNSCLDPLTFDSPYWLVDIHSLYPHINTAGTTQERNWQDYFADYGYAQAVPLRHKNRRNK